MLDGHGESCWRVKRTLDPNGRVLDITGLCGDTFDVHGVPDSEARVRGVRDLT